MAAFADLYSTGMTIAGVARATGFHRDTVRSGLLRAGVQLRGTWRKWPVREDAFSPPVSQEAWYWIGFLAADGCVRGPAIVLVQHRSNEPTLRRFLAFVGSPGRPLRSTNNGRGLMADVSSPPLVTDVARHGVGPRKTYTMQASPLAAAEPMFWLGVFDGDGCMTHPSGGAPRLTMLGTEALMTQFAEFVRVRTTGELPAVRRHGIHRVWEVRISGDRARQVAELWLACSEWSLEAKRVRLERAARYESRRTRARQAVRDRPCHVCGVSVRRMPSQFRERVFCCREHYWQWRQRVA